MIHVCFGLHDATERYSKFTGTTICSIFENTKSEVTAHILHDNTLTADNRKKFLTLAEHYNQRVNFYNVDEICPREIIFLREKLADKLEYRFSIATFYRLFAKKIFVTRDIHKMIYLDSDIIVNLDIKDLWRQNLKKFTVAAVPEIDATLNKMFRNKFLINTGHVKLENYFCAGVMIFDLDKLEENFFRDGVQFLIDNPQCECLDQDILNAFFSANYLKLEQKFDSFVDIEGHEKNPVGKKIYHYAGQKIELDSSNAFNALWLKYFIKTPWFGVETFGRFYDKFGQIRLDLLSIMKESLAVLSAVMSGKTRAFFIMSAELPSMKQIFSIRDDEEVILADKKESLSNLVCSMAKAKGKKIFIIVVPNFNAVREILEQLDFVQEEDFMDGEIFFVPEKDKKFQSYQLIEKM